MKAKRVFTIFLAVLMIAMTVVSVSAAELTNQKPGGQTEVIAKISGSTPPDPGSVSYVITIPEVVDFQELEYPSDTSVPNYSDVSYTLKATEINNLDPTTQQISVYVKDQNATVNGDQEFYIANKSDANIKFSYDVYNSATIGDNSVNINRNAMTQAAGYYLTGFKEQGDTLNGTLRLDRNQLAAHQLADIVGDYSGYMVFFSAVETI